LARGVVYSGWTGSAAYGGWTDGGVAYGKQTGE